MKLFFIISLSIFAVFHEASGEKGVGFGPLYFMSRHGNGACVPYCVDKPCGGDDTCYGTCDENCGFRSSGPCVASGNCVSSKNYPEKHSNNEECTIEALGSGVIEISPGFQIEMCCDHLEVAGIDVNHIKDAPPMLSVGDQITWTSDFSVTRSGWQICFVEVPEIECWKQSSAGVDLAPGEWEGTGYTSFATCVQNANGAKYFAWTGQVYPPGYCKVLKLTVSQPNLGTNQGYGYKLWENICTDVETEVSGNADATLSMALPSARVNFPLTFFAIVGAAFLVWKGFGCVKYAVRGSYQSLDDPMEI